MPGAAPVPMEDGKPLWRNVEESDLYEFCAAIAQLIDDVDTRVHVDTD